MLCAAVFSVLHFYRAFMYFILSMWDVFLVSAISNMLIVSNVDMVICE